MTFNDLRYIVVIAEENSITKAADKLYMTQSALSKRINCLLYTADAADE